jgi:hypothetical protein
VEIFIGLFSIPQIKFRNKWSMMIPTGVVEKNKAIERKEKFKCLFWITKRPNWIWNLIFFLLFFDASTVINIFNALWNMNIHKNEIFMNFRKKICEGENFHSSCERSWDSHSFFVYFQNKKPKNLFLLFLIEFESFSKEFCCFFKEKF